MELCSWGQNSFMRLLQTIITLIKTQAQPLQNGSSDSRSASDLCSEIQRTEGKGRPSVVRRKRAIVTLYSRFKEIVKREVKDNKDRT